MFATRSVSVAVVALFGLLLTVAPSRLATGGEEANLVTLGGKPLAAGKITFHREDGQFVGSENLHAMRAAITVRHAAAD